MGPTSGAVVQVTASLLPPTLLSPPHPRHDAHLDRSGAQAVGASARRDDTMIGQIGYKGHAA